MIQFVEGVNEIQYIQCSMIEVAEEQAKNKVWREVFRMKDRVLMFTKAANRNQIGEVWPICLLESMVTKVCSLCHQSHLGGHRVLDGTLNKFLKGFFLVSA